ncbi:MAG TPA: hypothetical protein VE860_09335 [Chthoniobacterales bacterium]|jgi:hypothetical protein|nr:hypothetical protein [Chthoniobacterales bacterium]
MDRLTHYFQVDFEGEATTRAVEFQKKPPRRTIVVEVHAGKDSKGGRSAEEDAAEIARTRACGLARPEFDDSINGEGITTQLEDFPPVLRDVQPDIDEPEVRAWLFKG